MRLSEKSLIKKIAEYRQIEHVSVFLGYLEMLKTV